MIRITFTEEEIAALRYERFNHPHPRVMLKMEVLLLKSQGVAHGEICRIAGITENTLRSYLRAYQEGGVEALKQLNFAKPVSDMEDHRETLEKHFRDNPPRSTAHAAAEIERLTGIKRSLTQVRKFLKKMGMSFRKVGMFPAGADPIEQQEFLDMTLGPRLRQAEKLHRGVFFVDAAHFIHGAFLGFLWCFVQVLIPGSSGRKRFNVLGAVDAVTHQMITVCNTTVIRTPEVCELFHKIRAAHPEIKLTLFLDNAKYQNNDIVFAAAKALSIELIYLPTYSPNLNLIERVWRFVKKDVLYSRHYEKFSQFQESIENCLSELDGEHKEEMKTLLTHKFQMFDEIPQLQAA